VCVCVCVCSSWKVGFLDLTSSFSSLALNCGFERVCVSVCECIEMRSVPLPSFYVLKEGHISVFFQNYDSHLYNLCNISLQMHFSLTSYTFFQTIWK
jgi:hypothetical protein